MARKVKDESRTSSCVKKAKKCSKNDGDLSKVYRNQFEGAPTGQIRHNLSIKINKDSNELESIE